MTARMIAAAAALTLAAAAAVAGPQAAEAACHAPSVVVTHGTAFAQAHVIYGCNIRVRLTASNYGSLVGPWKSGNSYSVISKPKLCTAARHCHGGWQQDIAGRLVYHPTF